MVATLWLLSLLTVTLIRASECVYATPPLVKYQRLDNIPFGIQDVYIPEKRTKTSLSIIAPLDVLRQRLLLEIARRQMRENSLQAQKNRELLKNIGKRSSGDERPNELERFEPYQQHASLAEMLNSIAEAASQSNDRTFYNMQTPDYYVDESNAIDAKPMRPSRFHTKQTTHFHMGRYVQPDPYINSDDSEAAWHSDKQMNIQQQKQQPINIHKSLFRQLNQENNDKINTDQQQQQTQEQTQQKQQIKSFNSNGDFIQSLDLN